MAHLPCLAEINPGLTPIAQRQPMALVQPGTPFKGIQQGQHRPGHGIDLAANPTLRGDGHGKRAQVVETGTLQPGRAEPTGALEKAMVGLTALEGAVNKKHSLVVGSLLLCQVDAGRRPGQPHKCSALAHRLPCSPQVRTLGDNDANRRQPMTIALLLVLLGSLGLMAFIVKRLERA
jgi:hypothetical protein